MTQEFDQQIQNFKSQEQVLKEELSETKQKLETATENKLSNEKHSELNGQLKESKSKKNCTLYTLGFIIN
jgi:hypothetical protein